MVTLNLSPEEQQSLIDLLENDIGELRAEIRKTDNSGYKDMLNHKKEIMVRLLEELYQSREIPTAS